MARLGRGGPRPRAQRRALPLRGDSCGEMLGTEITLGRIRDGKREHRPSLDVTMQAPKSVSLAVIFASRREVESLAETRCRPRLDRG